MIVLVVPLNPRPWTKHWEKYQEVVYKAKHYLELYELFDRVYIY